MKACKKAECLKKVIQEVMAHSDMDQVKVRDLSNQRDVVTAKFATHKLSIRLNQ